MLERIRSWLVRDKTYREHELTEDEINALVQTRNNAYMRGKGIEFQLDDKTYEDIWVNAGDMVPDNFKYPFNS